jgi:hypothetical protein
LQGKPEDKSATSQETRCSVSETLAVELPAYSFTVYRMKTKASISKVKNN